MEIKKKKNFQTSDSDVIILSSNDSNNTNLNCKEDTTLSSIPFINLDSNSSHFQTPSQRFPIVPIRQSLKSSSSTCSSKGIILYIFHIKYIILYIIICLAINCNILKLINYKL